jgi:hypothetical protein
MKKNCVIITFNEPYGFALEPSLYLLLIKKLLLFSFKLLQILILFFRENPISLCSNRYFSLLPPPLGHFGISRHDFFPTLLS